MWGQVSYTLATAPPCTLPTACDSTQHTQYLVRKPHTYILPLTLHMCQTGVASLAMVPKTLPAL